MNKLSGKCTNLRVFCGESDKYENQVLYEAIVYAARHAGLAGATVFRGVMSYGPSHSIHTLKMFALSSDLPMIVDIVDTDDRINDFLPIVEAMIKESGKGAMVSTFDVNVKYYEAGAKHRD